MPRQTKNNCLLKISQIGLSLLHQMVWTICIKIWKRAWGIVTRLFFFLQFLSHFFRKVLDSKLFVVYLHIPTNKGNRIWVRIQVCGQEFWQWRLVKPSPSRYPNMGIPQFVVMHQTWDSLPIGNTLPGETGSQGHIQLSELHNGWQMASPEQGGIGW